MDKTPQIGTAATAGRVGMIAAAVATFAALFSAHIFNFYSRVDVIATIGVVTVAGCAIASLLSPRRALDVVALAAGASIAGFLTPLWAEQYASSTMAMLAWGLLVLSCAGLGIGLSTGSPEADPRAAAAMAGAAGRVRQAAASPKAAPVAPSAVGGEPNGAPAAGWYRDDDDEQLRWWDGRNWTDHVRALP